MGRDFMKGNTLFFAVVDRGKANRLLHAVQACGAKGGTIFLGEGTMQSPLLDMLGINQVRKEILMTAVPDGVSDKLYETLTREFKLHKKYKGIAFTTPFRRWSPDAHAIPVTDRAGDAPWRCLMTVVDQGRGHACMKVAREAGAAGGTIVHAHGAGVPKDFYFPLMVEPQKDVVMIVVPAGRADAIRNAIYTGMELAKPGKGIIFTLPVLNTVGLYQKDRREGVK
jgi:nitrogen regulatory protein PII